MSDFPAGRAAPIRVTASIALDPSEIEESFVRAAGPGGQHVNKTSTAIELRFDVANSPSLTDDIKARLTALGGSRMTQEGVLVLFAQGHRSQEMNRQDARERLVELIRRATEKPKPRRPTEPRAAAGGSAPSATDERNLIRNQIGRAHV